jgi:beta-lactamase regulating signal transducer with metallopeptidase domain
MTIEFIINHLWQSSCFVLLVTLLTFMLRKNAAKVRYLVWLTASLKFLVPFALLVSLGSVVPWPARRAVVPAAPVFSSAVVQIMEPVSLPAYATVPGHAPLHWVPAAIGVLWALGFLTITLMRCRSWLGVRATLRAGTPVELPISVRAVITPGAEEPGVVGFLRPVLVLPTGMLEHLNPRQVSAILAHEMCHVRRRDNFFAAVHMVVETVFWFHPLAWWIGSHLLEERELACDEEVVRAGCDPMDYVDGILKICQFYRESPLPCVAGVTGANVKKRVRAILRGNGVRELNVGMKVVLAAFWLACLATPVAVGVLNTAPLRAQSQSPFPELNSASPSRLTTVPSTPPTGRGRVREISSGVGFATKNESSHRLEYAQTHFSTAIGTLTPMGRTYVQYGPPDQVEDENPDLPNTSVIWRYSYLEDFRSNVEFEFAQQTGTQTKRLNWPPPIATYEGEPEVAAGLVERLNRESQNQGEPLATNAVAGIPGRHASFQIYGGELSPRVLSVPLDWLSTPVFDIIGQISTRSNAGAIGSVIANVRDHVKASTPTPMGPYQASFTLQAGSYICQLIVKEAATGRMYGEAINFEVK